MDFTSPIAAMTAALFGMEARRAFKKSIASSPLPPRASSTANAKMAGS
jgi:hypothetical protein